MKSEYTLQQVKRLDTKNFKLANYVQNVYIMRDADEEARKILKNIVANHQTTYRTIVGICIIGKPAQGKTRLAWEAMQAELPDWTLMRWLDDLHEFANQ